MQSKIEYGCSVCGKKAHKVTLKTANFFCTQGCYDTAKDTPHCVPFYRIGTLVSENEAFRKILYTDAHTQLVLMRLAPGEKIGDERDANKPEIHPTATQMMRVEAGEVTLTLYNDAMEPRPRVMRAGDEDMVVIPQERYHLVENTGKVPARLSVLYSPPVH